MNRIYLVVVSVIIGLCIMVGNVSLLKAQESASEEFTLEEITVTAQKREENSQKVSATMEVISADDIRVSGKNDLVEILENISSAVITVDADGMKVNLRGLGDDSQAWHQQPTSMPTVAINTDGVYSSRRDTSSGLFDLERVEVLYGPQSTLYASNSPGGIVNVITASPKLNAYDLSGSLEYGNYTTIHAEGAMNLPLGDKIALRAAYSVQSHDAYMTNGQQDEDIKSARLRALFQPNERFSLTLTGEVSKSSDHTQNYVPQQWYDPDEVDDPWWSDTDLEMPRLMTNKKIYASMDLDLGLGTVTFLPSYGTSEGGGATNSPALGTITGYRDTEEKGGELRMASNADSLFTWIAGLYYYDSSDLLRQSAYEYEDVADYDYLIQDGTIGETSKAIYGNITYPVTDRFRGIVGYRQSWSELEVHRIRIDSPLGVGAGYVVEVPEDYHQKYQNPDYKLGVEYDLSEDSMIYTNWATSYRAQGVAAMTETTDMEYPPPEKLNAYTLGAKNRFFNNKLQVNATIFYYDYKNKFVQESKDGYYGEDLEETPTSAYVETDSGSMTWGDGHMMGFDFQSSIILTPKDTLDLSASYLKTEWDDVYFNYEYEWEAVGDYDSSEVVDIEIIPMEDEDFSGKPMTHAPKYTVNLGYKHRFSLWNGGALETGINVNYKSGYQLTWDDDDYPYNYQKACYKIDLNGTYDNPDGKWSISGYVRNLTNYAEKTYYNSRSDGETGVSSPRTYGVVLSVRY